MSRIDVEVKRIILTSIVATLLSGCASIGEQVSDIVFIPHHKSSFVKNEENSLTLIYGSKNKTEPIAQNNPQVKAALAGSLTVGTIASALIGVGLDQVEKSLEAESKRYIASYSSGDSAIIENFDTSELKGFIFTRMIKKEKAMKFCGRFQVIDPISKIFIVKPYAIDLYKTKAKIVAFDLTSPFGIDLLNPWEVVTDWFGDSPPRIINDNKIDLNIGISFTNFTIDKKDGSAKIVNLGSQTFPFNNLKAGAPNDMNSESNIVKNSCEDFDPYSRIDVRDSDAADMQAIMISPKTVSNQSKHTIFGVTMKITEVDEFSKRVKELDSTFKSQRPGIQNQLNNLFPSNH